MALVFQSFCAKVSQLSIVLVCEPPWSRLLVPGVFKLNCFIPFTPFLHLVSVYRPFQLYFISKTLNTSIFSSLIMAYFYLTYLSTTQLFFIYFFLLSAVTFRPSVFAVRCIPCRVEDGILVAEVPRGVQHASSARTSTRWVVGFALPNQSAGHALP